MALSDALVTMVAKKDYKSFEAEMNKEVESKLKSHLAGFTGYLEKTAFQKDME
jgi:hypothetical protein